MLWATRPVEHVARRHDKDEQIEGCLTQVNMKIETRKQEAAHHATERSWDEFAVFEQETRVEWLLYKRRSLCSRLYQHIVAMTFEGRS